MAQAFLRYIRGAFMLLGSSPNSYGGYRIMPACMRENYNLSLPGFVSHLKWRNACTCTITITFTKCNSCFSPKKFLSSSGYPKASHFPKWAVPNMKQAVLKWKLGSSKIELTFIRLKTIWVLTKSVFKMEDIPLQTL